MKKIMKIALPLILCAGMILSAFALDLDITEKTQPDADYEAVLSADASTANAAPGKNIFTGTTNALTFDDASDLDYFTHSSFNSVSLEETTAIYGTANSALKLVVPGTTAGNQVTLYLRAGFNPATDRPIAALFDFNDKWLAFQWAAGNTGFIANGWAEGNKNYNVRKTNAATSTATSLTAFKLDFTVPATTWTPQTSYMDNVAVIPYYKVTYDMPDSIADVVRYTLAEEDGNGNIALTMTPDGAISGFATSYTVDETVAPSSVNAEFLGWALKDAPTEVVTSVALENEDIVLVPVFEVKTAPGKNVFTGTTNALTFDNASDVGYFTSSGFSSVSLEATTDIYGTANSALKLVVPGTSVENQISPFLRAGFIPAIDRPVAALFDFNDKWLAFQWGAGNTGFIDGGWNENKNYNVRKTNAATTTATSLTAFKLDFSVPAKTWTPQTNYMDNVAVIPYYKVTYDMPEGTADVVRYTLAEEDGNGNIALTMTADGTISGFATSYTVDNAIVANADAGFKFLGWALENAPTEVVTSVALENEDIVLVPVFKSINVDTANAVPGKNVFTGTTNALTFDDAGDVDYFTSSGFNSVSIEATTAIYGGEEANSALKLVVPGTSVENQISLYLRAGFNPATDRPIAALFDFNDKWLAFQWGAGNTGFIDGGWNENKNYNVRKTNAATSTATSLTAFKLDFSVPAKTWTPQTNYMDNVAVIPYYKVTYDMPEGTADVVRYTLAEEDGNGNIALTMTADGAISGFATSYTVDTAIVVSNDVSKKFIGWALESAPTEVVTSVALENEDIVLVPVFETRELVTYSEQYGEMLFTTDLEGDTYNITNATLLGLLEGGDNEAVTYDENTGYRGYGLTEGAFYPVTWALGGGFEFAVPEYTSAICYNDGTNVLGTVTIVFNAYNEGSAAASWYDYFKQPTYAGGTAWTGLRSTYFAGTAPVGGWNEIVYTNSYIEEPTTIIGLSQKDRRDVVYGDITVYVKPANALWLTDANGENREFEIVSGTDFTFPESFNGESVNFWTDGESAYEAGETAEISEVAGKTFKPLSSISPDMLNVASIRITGVKGMRLVSFVDYTRRNTADSYGFIVARNDSLESNDYLVLDETDPENGTNKYGVRYLSQAAYVKGTSVDRKYTTNGAVFGDNGFGDGIYFTAVLHNINEAHYKTEFAVRPYLVKDGIYFYGNTIVRSLYEVACDIRDNGYKGLDEDEAGIKYVNDIIDSVNSRQ